MSRLGKSYLWSIILLVGILVPAMMVAHDSVKIQSESNDLDSAAPPPPQAAGVSPKYLIYRYSPSNSAYCNLTYEHLSWRDTTTVRGRVYRLQLGVGWVPGNGLTMKVNTHWTTPNDFNFTETAVTDINGYFFLTITVPDDFNLGNQELIPFVSNDAPEYTAYPDWGNNFINFTVYEKYDVEITGWTSPLTRLNQGIIQVNVQGYDKVSQNYINWNGVTVQVRAGGTPITTGSTSGAGVASMTFTPPADFGLGDHELSAIVAGVPAAFDFGDDNLPTDKFLTIQSQPVIEHQPVSSAPNAFFPGETITYRGLLKDEADQGISGQQITFREALSGEFIANAFTDDEGIFDYRYRLETADVETTINVSFTAAGNYLKTSTEFSFLFITGVDVELFLPATPPAPRDSFQINGTLTLEGTTTPLAYRPITVQVGNNIQIATTDAFGNFTVNMQAPENNGTYDVSVVLTNRDTGNFEIEELMDNAVEVVLPRGGGGVDLSQYWWVWLVTTIPAAVVIVLFLLYRRGVFKRKPKLVTVTGITRVAPEYIQMVEMLFRAGKVKEAASYLFNQIIRLVKGIKDIAKDPAVTIRKFSDQLVEEKVMPSEVLYPFAQKVEEILYSGTPVAKDDILQVFDLFAKLYQYLTNSPVEVALNL